MFLLVMVTFIFTGSGAGSELDIENCDTSELNTCLDLIPKTPVGLPTSKQELDAHCLAYQTGMSCMETWMKRCLPTDGLKLIQKQIGGARALMRYLCTNETSLRKVRNPNLTTPRFVWSSEFLKEVDCWSKVSTGWTRCAQQLHIAVLEISDHSQLLAYFNRNTELCCARDAYMTCISHIGRKCSANASTLLWRMARVLAHDVAICSQPRAVCAATLNMSTVITLLVAVLTLHASAL